MTSRWAAALLTLLLYAALCAAVAWRHRRGQQAARRRGEALLATSADLAPVLVLHASQTGESEALAWQTARTLSTAGVPVRLAALGEVTRADLRQAQRALIIASTYGEGDAPDSAAPFAGSAMGAADVADDLAGLQYGLLALGDSTYVNYCGFGRALDAWLCRQGAQPLFERIDVDKGDPGALLRWQHGLSHLAGTADLPAWQEQPFEPWQLLERRLLNPGSQGEPLFHLELAPAGGAPLPAWEAGDLVQLRVPAEPQRPREYSIASLPADGRLHLLVRQARRPDGSAGAASGWLTDTAAVGGTVDLRWRAHPGFRLAANGERPLVLVGNGTGYAGLRAHLKTRAALPFPAPVWLVHGERQAAHDTHYVDELDHWQRAGWLRHVDRVFSRDQPERRHVQHLLAEQAPRLREWVADGAAVFVCGSLEGMARGVDEVLAETLGRDGLAELQAQGRYRRDVY